MKRNPLRLNLTLDMKLPRSTSNYNGELAFDYDAQKLFMYTDDSWVEIIERPNNAIVELQKKHLTNCPNCGAPHNTNIDYCEYCGTFF